MTGNPHDVGKNLEILKQYRSEIEANCLAIEDRFREISYILGWNFSPKIIRDAMLARMEISKMLALMAAPKLDESQTKEMIELYFDIDADSSAVLDSLANILGVSLTAS